HVSATRDGSTWTIYKNGVSQHSAANTAPTPNRAASLGEMSSQDFLGGPRDMKRYSSVKRSADWLVTEFNSQNSPSTFYTVGSASTPTPTTFIYRRSVTIDGSQVPSTQTNFPVLFAGTHSYLKTVANGGLVQNSSGYDLVFASDSTCSNGFLAFEIETYDATTGTINAWINVPILNGGAGTTYWLCYGNSSISTSQENAGLTWNSHYQGVWHLKDGTTLSLADSTIHGNTATNHSTTATTGEVDGGLAAVAASTEYLDFGSDASIDRASPVSIEAWAKFTGTFTNGVSPRVLASMNAAGTQGQDFYLSANDASPANTFTCRGANGGLITVAGNSSASTNTWYHIVCTYWDDANGFQVYVNGSGTTAGPTGPYANDGSTNVNLGRFTATPTGTYWTGSIDEVRIADTPWSADWVKAEYNIISSFSTCCTVGSASTGVHGFASVQ